MTLPVTKSLLRPRLAPAAECDTPATGLIDLFEPADRPTPKPVVPPPAAENKATERLDLPDSFTLSNDWLDDICRAADCCVPWDTVGLCCNPGFDVGMVDLPGLPRCCPVATSPGSGG